MRSIEERAREFAKNVKRISGNDPDAEIDEMTVGEYIADLAAFARSLSEPIVTHLNMDPNASQETKEAVGDMIRAAYTYKPPLTADQIMDVVRKWLVEQPLEDTIGMRSWARLNDHRDNSIAGSELKRRLTELLSRPPVGAPEQQLGDGVSVAEPTATLSGGAVASRPADAAPPIVDANKDLEVKP